MQPDPANLLGQIGLTTHPVGLYDAPDATPFEPLVTPTAEVHACVFAFYDDWIRGRTLHLTKDNFGCRGAGSCLLGVDTRSQEELVTFLVDGEGLKASRQLMRAWVERRGSYRPEHPNILIGPLRREQFQYLKTVTFFVNPDQLAALSLGANYHSGPDDPAPVISSFGSGCSQLVALLGDLASPKAIIGATDIAMRQFLPPDTLAFTVTTPMFQRLCELDERSFLYKPFLRNLRKAREHAERPRGGSAAHRATRPEPRSRTRPRP